MTNDWSHFGHSKPAILFQSTIGPHFAIQECPKTNLF